MLTAQRILDELTTVSYLSSNGVLNIIDLYCVLRTLTDLCQTDSDKELLVSVCAVWSIGLKPPNDTGDVLALLSLLLIR